MPLDTVTEALLLVGACCLVHGALLNFVAFSSLLQLKCGDWAASAWANVGPLVSYYVPTYLGTVQEVRFTKRLPPCIDTHSHGANLGQGHGMLIHDAKVLSLFPTYLGRYL